MRRRCRPRLTLVLLMASAMQATAARALADAERVLVLVVDADDVAFVDRLRGQVSDLPVEVATESVPADLDDAGRRRLAERLVREHRAQCIVWYRQGMVSIVVPEDGAVTTVERSFAEERDASGEEQPRDMLSADLEAAAVVVRSTLLQPPRPPPPPAPPSGEVGGAAPVAAPSARHASRIACSALVGWQAQHDGLDAPDQSLVAEVSVSMARFEAGAVGAIGGSRDLSSARDATAGLRRGSVGLVAGVLFVDSARWRFGARLTAGAAAFDLTSQLSGVAPRTDSRVRLFGGMEARLAALGRVGRVPVQLALGLGVTAVEAAPTLYAGATAATRLALWEPHLNLLAGVLFR